MPGSRGPDARDVSLRLSDRIEELAQQVIRDGAREGREWRGTGPDGARWSVVLTGHKRGLWANWGDNRQRGDALELVRWGLCEGDRGKAYKWALEWLGLDHDQPPPPRTPQPREEGDCGRYEVERIRRAALARFLAAEPDIRGKPPGSYLLDDRAIDLTRLPAVPGSLRSGRVWNSERGTMLPAMVAAIVSPVTGQHIASHTTYLEQDPEGRWRKLCSKRAKMVLGAFRGGVIPLLRGPSGKSLRHAPDGDKCLLSEGIEDALTMALAHPDRRVLAGVSVGHFPAIELPPGIRDVMLVLQRDGLNPAVDRTRSALIAKLEGEGRTVRLWQPPEGFVDANAYWQYCSAAAAAGEKEGAA